MKTKEEWIELMHQQDEKVGSIKGTLLPEYEEKRNKRVEAFNEKTEKIVEYLEKNNIKYVLCQMLFTKNHMRKYTTDIFLPEYMVIMRHSGEGDEEAEICRYYHKLTKKFYYPLFIRDREDADFILVKVENVIQKAKNEVKFGWGKQKPFIKAMKRKRVRISAVKVRTKKY